MLEHVEAEELLLADRGDRRGRARTSSAIPSAKGATRQSASACRAGPRRVRAQPVGERRSRPTGARGWSGSSVQSPLGTGRNSEGLRVVQLFHYHLVTSRVRQVEAATSASSRSRSSRGTAGSARTTSRSSRDVVGGARPDGLQAAALGARARGVNVVVQPGQWELAAGRPPRARARRGRVRGRDRPRRATASCGSRRTAAGARSSRRTRATGSRCTRRASGSRSFEARTPAAPGGAAPARRRSRDEGRGAAELLAAEREGRASRSATRSSLPARAARRGAPPQLARRALHLTTGPNGGGS